MSAATGSSPQPHLAPKTKGWCPSLLRPMQAADGLVARIKPTAAVLPVPALRQITALAGENGKGVFEITRRSSLQARGFDEAGHRVFAAGVIDQGLALNDQKAEELRNVRCAPFGPKDDPSVLLDAPAIAKAIEALMPFAPALSMMPGKVGVAVCGGGKMPLAPQGWLETADVTVLPDAHGAPLLRLQPEPDQRYIYQCRLGDQSSPTHIANAVLALLVAFEELRTQQSPILRRVKPLVAAIGAKPIFAQAGLDCVAVELPSIPLPPSAAAVGTMQLSTDTAAVIVAPAFGRLSADQLTNLAELAEERGDNSLRIAPNRLIALPCHPRAADELLLAADRLGFVTDPTDPRLRIDVCTGWPDCAHGQTKTLTDAPMMATHLPDELYLHLSGCEKGCAKSGPSRVTLVGRDHAYDLIENGTIDAPPVATGLSPAEAARLLRALKP